MTVSFGAASHGGGGTHRTGPNLPKRSKRSSGVTLKLRFLTNRALGTAWSAEVVCSGRGRGRGRQRLRHVPVDFRGELSAATHSLATGGVLEKTGCAMQRGAMRRAEWGRVWRVGAGGRGWAWAVAA